MSVVDSISLSRHELPHGHYLMHSFFKPVYTGTGEGVDETCRPTNAVNTPSEGHPIDVNDGPEPGQQSLPAMDSEETGIRAQIPPSNYNPQADVTMASPSVQVSADRRKRRKLSTEPEGLPDGARNGSTLPVSATTQTNLEQLNGCGAQQDAIVTGSTQSSATPITPKRRRGRPPKSHVITETASTTDSQRHRDNPETGIVEEKLALSPKSKIPSRKKTLQIGANGRLLAEPQSSPRRSTPSRTVSTTTAKNSRSTALTLKGGRLTQTLTVKIRYPVTGSTGPRIDEIMAKAPESRSLNSTRNLPPTTAAGEQVLKTTHPFFLGKKIHRPASSLSNASAQDTHVLDGEDSSTSVETKKPVAWTDLVFKSNKPSVTRDQDLQKAPWPSSAFQHIGRVMRDVNGASQPKTRAQKQKSKAALDYVSEPENVMTAFSGELSATTPLEADLHKPTRLCCPSTEAMSRMSLNIGSDQIPAATASVKNEAQQGLSAFDRGEAPGPLPWTQQYAPSTWQQVLQPCSNLLHDWLESLAVHNVKQGLDKLDKKEVLKKRKKPKKHVDELDDFIVDDDDSDEENAKVKNAILLVGPNGCGKTASVFAIAKQLGFEVFEIHAGMQRGQRDIFAKVGDMAQNHLVRSGQNMSRESSVARDTEVVTTLEDTKQQSLASVLGGPTKSLLKEVSRKSTPVPSKNQKQSVILFEEVDQVFEEDRGFWSGVQALIKGSKRPVIMTCNDTHSIPFDELDLHSVLTYVAPSPDTVSAYLSYMALTEGHIIQHNDIRTLYHSKGDDLRATITELDFWCQMTVGSDRGGLDWYPDLNEDSRHKPVRARIYSDGTYRAGLDLMPTKTKDLEDGLRFFNDCLHISADDLLERLTHKASPQSFSEAFERAEMISDVVTMQPSVQPLLAASMCKAGLVPIPQLDKLALATYSAGPKKLVSNTTDLYKCLESLTFERPVFPPAQGRLAPSLDLPRSILATDLGPYVRSIAAFDQRLEQQRDELYSSQGKKARTTRAARAAAEGGDKANTRRENWFPADLDLDAVLRTGNGWPQWDDHEREHEPESGEHI